MNGNGSGAGADVVPKKAVQFLAKVFEHKHENKSSSPCREGVNERVQVLHVLQVPSFCLTFRHFFQTF